MAYRIRDWCAHFERDRTKQWKRIDWVPIPNKQGSGYRRIMAEKNGLEIFGAWIALVEVASTCDPRGDLSKHPLSVLSLLTLIPEPKLVLSIKYLSQTLDWIEDVTNLDSNVNGIDSNVNDLDSSVGGTAIERSILFSSIQSNSEEGTGGKPKRTTWIEPTIDETKRIITALGYTIDAEHVWNHYNARGWTYGPRNTPIKSWRSVLVTWHKNEAKFSGNQPRREYNGPEKGTRHDPPPVRLPEYRPQKPPTPEERVESPEEIRNILTQFLPPEG